MSKKVYQYEDVKKYLRRYKKNQAIIAHYEEKLAKLDDRLYAVKSPNMTGEVRGGSPISTTELISDKMDLLERINKLVMRGRTYKAEIMECLDRIRRC